MLTILSRDTPLNVRTDGDDRRPALLLVNPLGTTLDIWDPFVEQLAEHNYIIRFDLRGHGASGESAAPYDIGDLGLDAIAILDALEIERAHIVGASLGGLVSVWLASQRPDRVDRLVLISTAPRLGPDYWWERTIATIEAEGLEAMVDHFDSILFSPEWSAAAPDRLHAVRDMLLATPTEAYLAGARAILACDTGVLLDSIRATTLLIVGDNDPMLVHHPAEDMLARIPDSEAVRVGGSKHRVFVEHPKELAKVVHEFLTDPDGR